MGEFNSDDHYIYYREQESLRRNRIAIIVNKRVRNAVLGCNLKNDRMICFIDHAKAFDCVDHNKLWKILKEMGIPDHLTCLLRNLYACQEATVRTGHGTTDWFHIGAVYCHPAYLTYMQSTCKMLNWMKYKLESRLLEEISITSDMQMTPP